MDSTKELLFMAEHGGDLYAEYSKEIEIAGEAAKASFDLPYFDDSAIEKRLAFQKIIDESEHRQRQLVNIARNRWYWRKVKGVIKILIPTLAFATFAYQGLRNSF